MTIYHDLFRARTALESAAGTSTYYRLEALTEWGVQGLDRLPFTFRASARRKPCRFNGSGKACLGFQPLPVPIDIFLSVE